MTATAPDTPVRLMVLEGDGIGPEIINAALAVLEATGRRLGLDIACEHFPIGFAALEQEGTTFPSRIVEAVPRFDGIILGPVSH